MICLSATARIVHVLHQPLCVPLHALLQDTAPPPLPPPAAAPAVTPSVSRVLPLLWFSKVYRLLSHGLELCSRVPRVVLPKDLLQDTAPPPLPPAAVPTVKPSVSRVLQVLWFSKVYRLFSHDLESCSLV